MGKVKKRGKPQVKALSLTTGVSPSGEGIGNLQLKLTKQEKRNLKKKERLLADPGRYSNHTRLIEEVVNPVTTSVYKRIPTYPKSFSMAASSVAQQGFIEAHNKYFKRILENCYQGFAIEQSDKFSREFHEKFQRALKGLESMGLYQFDLTQPAGLGTKVARTFVTRCIVGEPGITYKYLGLRMFAFPWTPGTTGSNEFTIAIGELNKQLIIRSNKLNEQSGKSQYGSSNFNLTLINRCFPENEEVALKNEPMFEKDKLTVSWHADSCLDHFSSIAVYHFNEPNGLHKITKPWRIALRVQVNAEGPQQGKVVPDLELDCPPIALSLPEECCYYLLDDFNHHHQHAVLAGGSHRFASTHRVSRREGHTYHYLHQKIQNVLQEKLTADRKTIRRVFLAAHEIEFEWIRQFYIQGRKHHDLHVWWHAPMTELKRFLYSLDQRLVKMCRALFEIINGGLRKYVSVERLSKDELKMKKLIDSVEAGSLDEMVTQLNERLEKRIGWESREKDSIFEGVEESNRPLTVPLEDVYDLWAGFRDMSVPTAKDSNAITSCKTVIKVLQNSNKSNV